MEAHPLVARYLTRGAQITGVATMSLCLTWISVSLRFYVRIRILKFIGKEDWLTFAAMVLFTALCSILLRTTDYGLGAHMRVIPADQLQIGLKYIFVCELLYVLTTAVAKLSIGLYFLRLASKKYQTRIIYTTMVTVMVYSTMYFFFLLFQCSPVSFIWTQYENGDGTCLGTNTIANVAYAHAAMSAVTDWSFGILPVFFVWKMKMTPRTKFSVILILSLGFFASTATIVRIVYIRQLQLKSDYSWFGINLVKWSMAEPAIGITAASIATLRPLFVNFLSFSRKNIDGQSNNASSISTTSLTRSHTKESRPSASSRASSGLGPYGYSNEFAEMLGLTTYGVTTTVSAGNVETRGEKRMRERARREREKRVVDVDCESQTELRDIEGKSESDASGFGWDIGIKATTTVVIDG